jgi:hypothetical protein
VYFVIGAIAICLGLVCLFRREWMWQLTRWGNEWEGQGSERSELWDTRTTISGVVFVVVGLGVIVLGFTR